jgi:ribosomal protein S18 acetylase RimI-like enzyme
MVTLKYKENYSEIGLLAVNEHERKKGIGRDLMNKCFEESIENSLYQINVTTQIDNKIACKFYEKCGFTTDTITNIYHLWL